MDKLLEQILSHEKHQWHTGEVIWLIKQPDDDPKFFHNFKGIFLKNVGCEVHLCSTPPAHFNCMIWYLDLDFVWKRNSELEEDFEWWALAHTENLERLKGAS